MLRFGGVKTDRYANKKGVKTDRYTHENRQAYLYV